MHSTVLNRNVSKHARYLANGFKLVTDHDWSGLTTLLMLAKPGLKGDHTDRSVSKVLDFYETIGNQASARQSSLEVASWRRRTTFISDRISPHTLHFKASAGFHIQV